MIRRGIALQLLVAGILPASVVALVVGVWLASLRVADLRDHQRELGHAMVTQLAPAAEFGVFSGNRVVLQRLAEAALDEADLRAVTIRDHDGRVLALAKRDAQPGAGPGRLALRLARMFTGDHATSRYAATITQPLTDLGEFDLPGAARPPRTLGTVEIEIALLPALARQMDAALTGVYILLAGLLISFLLAQRLGKRIADPIERLAGAMRRVQEGQPDVRVEEVSANELGLLEAGLNNMALEVQKTRTMLEERVSQATRELADTVQSLEVINVELDLARKRAVDVSRSKSDFLAAMSHEIRTPMSGIIGFTDLLARTELTFEQREQVLTVRRSASALLSIINDVLDLSTIEAGRLVLNPVVFDVRACVDETLAQLAPLAYEKHLVLRRCVLPDVPLRAVGDRTRIQQVLTNLVSNAIKYTHAGSVTVEVTRMAGHTPLTLGIAVTDTGIGISRDIQHRLFQAFSRGTETPALDSGTGLGLMICNRLVDAMGGEIDLVSEPGRGSRFAVTLALEPAREPVVTQPSALSGHRVLLYERDELCRSHLAQVLAMTGLRVTATGTLEDFEPVGFDLVVAGFPGFDLDAVTVFAGWSDHKVPTLLLLGTLDPAAVEAARRRVPAMCLPHCVAPATLGNAVEAVLGVATSAEAAASAGTLAGEAVAIADDNRVNRVLLKHQLEHLGATVYEHRDGEGLLKTCESSDITIALVDLQMPGMGGLATARHLSAGVGAPMVVAVTANAHPRARIECSAAGISAVLVKPLDESTLVERVSEARDRRNRVFSAVGAVPASLRGILAEDFPAQADALRRALLNDDPVALHSALHDLAGTAGACKLRMLAAAVTRALRSADGEPSELLGMLTDIEAALRRNEQA